MNQNNRQNNLLAHSPIHLQKVITNNEQSNNEHTNNDFVINFDTHDSGDSGDSSSDSSSSICNPTEPWSDEIELLLTRWKNQVEKLSFLHDESGYLIKWRYYRLAIPAILVPFSMTFGSQLIGCTPESKVVDGVMFMLTSILAGFQTLFGYGQLFEEHFQYSARYSDIVNRIDTELARDRKFRIPAGIFVTEIKCKIENLNDTSPELPMNCC